MNPESEEQRRIKRELEKQERYPWLLLFQCFQAATHPQVLALAILGAIATTAGWRLADKAILKTAHKIEFAQVESDSASFAKWPGQRTATKTWHPTALTEWLAPIETSWGPPPDGIWSIPRRFVGPVHGIARRERTRWTSLYYLLGGLWTVLVWSGFGVAISRMAAQRYTRDEAVSALDGFRYAQSKIVASLGGMLCPLVAILVLTLPMMGLGLLMRFDAGLVIAGILWLFTVPIGFVLSIVILGLLFGWPLIWGAVAVDSSDGFDAVSRSYAYTFQRPLHYLAYAILAVLVGILGWFVVWILSELVANVGLWAASVTTGRERMAQLLAAPTSADASGSAALAAKFISFWNGLIRTVASGYGYSYFWSATTAIYLLLRHQVDHVELDEIKLASDIGVGTSVAPGAGSKTAFSPPSS